MRVLSAHLRRFSFQHGCEQIVRGKGQGTTLLSRRHFIRTGLIGGAGLAAGSIWPTKVAFAAGSSGERFRIVHFTDIHVQPQLDGNRGFAQAIHEMNKLNPDFGTSGGDLVFDVLGADVDRATRLFKMYGARKKDFDFPVYEVMGNHDNFGLNNRDKYSAEPLFGKKWYLETMELEKTYYSFDHKGWHFVVLDSIKPKPDKGWAPRLDDEQMEWLKADLKASTLPKCVALHVPIVTIAGQLDGGPLAANGEGSTMNDGRELRLMFEANNVRLVLQGHVHIREQFIYKDVAYITSGAVSGAWWKGPHKGHPEGFASIDFDGDNFEWNYHTYGWKAKEVALWTPEDYKAAEMLKEREIFALV